MAQYQITAPDGTQYEITAPEGATEQDVLAYAQSQLGEQEQQAQGEGDALGGIRTFAGGMLLGGGSEGAGLTAGLYGAARQAMEGRFSDVPETFSRMYTGEEERARGLESEFAARNPKTALGLNVAGALTTAAPMAAAGMAGVAGAGIVPRVAASAGLGLVEGAAAGGLSAAPGERAGGAALGGAFGGAAGLLFPVIGATMGPAVRRAYEALTAKFGATSKQARDYLARAMMQSKVTADDLTARMREAAPGAAPVDIADAIAGLGEAAVQRPGIARQVGLDFARGRQADRVEAVVNMFDKAVGPAGREVFVPGGGANFAKTLEGTVPITPVFKSLFKRKSIKDAYNKARAIVQEESPEMLERRPDGRADFPEFDTFMDDINTGRIVGIQTKLLHYLKKGMDDVLEKTRDPMTGKINPEYGKNLTRNMEDTRKLFRGEVKRLNTDYADALDTLSNQFRLDDAYNLGRDALRMKHSVKAVQDRFKTAAEKRAYRNGAAEIAMDRVESQVMKGREISTALLTYGPKLKQVFGDKVVDALQGMQKQRAVENRIISGSQTGFRKEAQAALAEGVSPGEMALDVGASAAAGVPTPGILARGAKGVSGYLAGSPSGRALDELGTNFLFSQDPAKVAQYLGAADAARQNMIRMQGARGGLLGLLSQAPAISERSR